MYKDRYALEETFEKLQSLIQELLEIIESFKALSERFYVDLHEEVIGVQEFVDDSSFLVSKPKVNKLSKLLIALDKKIDAFVQYESDKGFPRIDTTYIDIIEGILSKGLDHTQGKYWSKTNSDTGSSTNLQYSYTQAQEIGVNLRGLYRTLAHASQYLTDKIEDFKIRYFCSENLIIIIKRYGTHDLLEDMIKELNIWKITLNGFGRIHDDSTPPKLVAIERGSVWEIFAVSAAVATTVLTLTNLTIKQLKDFYELRKVMAEHRASEIHALRDNVKFLEESADKYPKKIRDHLYQAIEAQVEGKGAEVKKHAKEAIKHLVDHLTDDGQVQFNLPEATPEQLELQEQTEEKFLALEQRVDELMQLDPERRWRLLLEEGATPEQKVE